MVKNCLSFPQPLLLLSIIKQCRGSFYCLVLSGALDTLNASLPRHINRSCWSNLWMLVS